jgi:hypothetical protein
MWLRPLPDRSEGFIVLVLFIPLYLASDPEGRRIVSVLQLAEATAPETGMTAYELDAVDSRTLRRLVRNGIVGEAPGARYYVNTSMVATFTRRWRLLAGLVAIPTIIVVAALILRLLFQ